MKLFFHSGNLAIQTSDISISAIKENFSRLYCVLIKNNQVFSRQMEEQVKSSRSKNSRLKKDYVDQDLNYTYHRLDLSPVTLKEPPMSALMAPLKSAIFMRFRECCF